MQPQPSPTTQPEVSPLGEPGPDSISELFDRYPAVTAEQAKKVIAHLRATRGKIGQDQKPVKEPKAVKAKADKAAPARPKLTLEELLDLGINLG